MKQKRYIAFGFITTIVCSAVFMVTVLSAKDNSNVTASDKRLNSLAKFTKVIQTVEKYYVDDIKIDEIINKSLEGLLTNLDAHSSFLDKKKFKDLKIQTEGEFGGLGITVGMRDGALTVIAPIEGTPADKAGLKSEDIILRIDNKSTLNMTIDEAVNLMRGKPKTKIVLTIVRKGEVKPFDVEIIRDIIKIDSVYSKIVEKDNILYIRITSFDKKVVHDTREAILKNPDVKGLILDLRNNPGGLLSQAVGLVDMFVEDGIIVSQKGKLERENQEFRATKNGTFSDIPVVVLINSGSASASEIVSGALQDHKRGVLIGKKTFGKGSVQVILPVDENEALRLTVARYYLPSGRTIQAKGVVPDILVDPGKVPVKEDEFALKEKDLKRHLEQELKKVSGEDKDKKMSKKDSEKDKSKEKIITEKDVLEDIQLKTAIDAIKILTLAKNGSH